MTKRMVTACEHPWIDAIGHPTGRKIERRQPYAVDMNAVIAAAARTGTMLEINSAPDRRDLNDVHARNAAEAGRADPHRLRRPRRPRARARALGRSRPRRRAWLTARAGREHAGRGRSSRRCASAPPSSASRPVDARQIRRMRRIALLLGVLAALGAAAVASAHELVLFDHPRPEPQRRRRRRRSQILAGGEDAEWELVATIPTGNPHSDLDFFTVGGDTYMSAGTLGVGPERRRPEHLPPDRGRRGQADVRRRAPVGGVPAATYERDRPAARRRGDAEGRRVPAAAQPVHRARATRSCSSTRPTPTGRCHDNGGRSARRARRTAAWRSSTSPTSTTPKEIALISHIGNAHTVNVDPKRPHIAFDITQDGVAVCADGPQAGKRDNEVDCTTAPRRRTRSTASRSSTCRRA